jgi:hypothetical protein
MSIVFITRLQNSLMSASHHRFDHPTLVEKDETVVNITIIIATKFESRPDILLSVASL